MARFKTLEFPNTPRGQQRKISALEKETARGWRVVSETIVPGKFKGRQACCLFLIFMPCAFLAGHQDDIITITLVYDEDTKKTPSRATAGIDRAATTAKESASTEPTIDHTKWNALLRYDKAIAAASETIRPLGSKWMDEFASAYLSINDRNYLTEIVEGIVERARLEQEDKAHQLLESALTGAPPNGQLLPTKGTPTEVGPGIGFPLLVGIFFLPFVFAWFTLRRGYSPSARIGAFVWMVAVIFIISIGNSSLTPTAERSIQTTAPQAPPTPSTDRQVAPQPKQQVTGPLSAPGQGRVGPSFECGAAIANQPLAQIICSSDELARSDLTYVMAYTALRQSLDEQGRSALREEANVFVGAVVDRCNIPKSGPFGRTATAAEITCIKELYSRQRRELLGRVSGDALEEAKLQPEEALAIQRALQARKFLPAFAAIDGVFGPVTRTAVASWQRSVGLRETGYASPTMLTQLSGAVGKP